ncbi:hypothetical protein C5Y96_21415 [Blastopirellula marina]|uniref:SMP-30/Gluconolactonase/LRE-like region domain-containing protein n=1 Tax=Blastopirellula marina TaxID=124 RepID=A0A2S8F1K1_9BACT|nr:MULTISPECIES: hypothetical protein [Pirellulaceae]PQO26013.1 hypothetical protein C5Y96_21415 [Blastopirellula marina]RCS44371.1 hypothetical protein DTL36_21460 [Bremerella cremea]
MLHRVSLPLAFVLFLVASTQAEIKPEVILEGLKCPSGVAVQPETGTVFVAETAASQVIRVVDGKAEVVVKDFPADEYGKGPVYQIGPLGLAFLDKNRLVVGDGSLKDGEEVIRIFDVPENGKEALAADAGQKTNPLAAEGDIPGEGNFYGVAIDAGEIYTTANGDDKKGWVARVTVDKEKVGKLERFIATKESVNVDAPAAIAISPRREVVVGQMGEINDQKDSLLTFYDQKSKSLLLSLPAEVFDLVGLAFSPKTGRLYAVDYSWADPKQGGLYRLDAVRRDGKQVVKATKLLDLDQPTALAFNNEGELFITLFGNGDGKDESKTPATGKLLKIGEGL